MKRKPEPLPYKVVGMTEEKEPKFIEKMSDGDVGVVVGRLGPRIVAQYKVRGIFAISESLEGDAFRYINEEKYNKTTKEEILAKRKKLEEQENENLPQSNGEQQGSLAEPKKEKKAPTTADMDKAEIRASLNQLTEKKLLAAGKKFKVDTAKYDHLNGGLKKMSIVNAVLGAMTQAIKKGTKTKEEILGSL